MNPGFLYPFFLSTKKNFDLSSIMQLKETSKDIYDVDAWLDDNLGKPGTPERERNTEKAFPYDMKTYSSSSFCNNSYT